MKTASFSRTIQVCALGFGVLALAVSGTGCSTGQANPARINTEFVDRDPSGDTIYLEKVEAEERPVNWKNYELGTRAEAKVGEPILAVRNYVAGDRVARSIALVDFVQGCKGIFSSGSSSASSESGTFSDEEANARGCARSPLSYMRGRTGQPFTVAGQFEENGETFYLNAIDTPDGTLFFATDRDGRLKRDDYLAWRKAGGASVVTQFGIPLDTIAVGDPLDRTSALVRYETEEYIVPESPNYVHYELLFAGTTYDQRGMVYHVLYKEFRRGGKQIPIYTKQLEFTSRKTTIELLSRRIRVYDVNDDRIVYAVQLD